ncbi:MAG TPA: LamG-like jellyroll fold domain-containing protein, partial [Gemmatimonadales bacterium]
MPPRNSPARATTTATSSHSKFLTALLLLSLGFTACENPQEPVEQTPAEPEHAVASDRHTLLLLRLNGSLAGVAGETPSQASGLTFVPGVRGKGVLVDNADRLAYATAGNIQAAAGTIEFWIKPTWNGDDQTNHCFVWLQAALHICKDAADNLRFLINEDDSEEYRVYNMGHWLAEEWHYVAVTWTVPGVMTEYIDGVQVVSHRSPDLIPSMPAEMFIGSVNGSFQAGGVMDNVRISDIPRTAEEIAASYATDPRIVSLAIEPITSEPFVTWRQPAKLRATTNLGTQDYPPSQAAWTSSNPAVATVNTDGVIKALKAGVATISAAIGEVQGSVAIRVKAPLLPPKVEQIHPYLATPASNSRYPMPVVILRYLPTADGVMLDSSVSPDYWELGHISLQDMERRLDTFDFRVKFMLEEGSRFRGYQNPDAQPALGYQVVAAITVYEPLPPGPVGGMEGGFPIYRPDHHQIFQRFNARHYVEDLGVKEFWIWHGGLTPGYPSYDPNIHKPES